MQPSGPESAPASVVFEEHIGAVGRWIDGASVRHVPPPSGCVPVSPPASTTVAPSVPESAGGVLVLALLEHPARTSTRGDPKSQPFMLRS
jgi:hypothetical protein